MTKIDQRDCWKCLEGDWPELHVCEPQNPVAQVSKILLNQSIDHQKRVAQPPLYNNKPQSQQGIIENWREGWRDYAHGDFVDPEPFIEFVLKHQLEKTRKETLEEVIEVLKLAPIWGINTGLIDHIRAGELYASWDEIFKKLQSLINKQ